MKSCSYCQNSSKVLVLRQDETEEKLICAPCLFQQYDKELGWVGKQVVDKIMKQIIGK